MVSVVWAFFVCCVLEGEGGSQGGRGRGSVGLLAKNIDLVSHPVSLHYDL